MNIFEWIWAYYATGLLGVTLYSMIFNEELPVEGNFLFLLISIWPIALAIELFKVIRDKIKDSIVIKFRKHE